MKRHTERFELRIEMIMKDIVVNRCQNEKRDDENEIFS